MSVERTGEQFAHLPTGLDLCFESFGERSQPTILLIMGLGGPMGWWDDEFCEQLAGRGFHVVRYDNRDTGRSTKVRQHKVSRLDLVRAFVGLGGSAPYGIGDLALDAIGLLDHLDVDAAHIVGVSMGGMIAQTLAIAYPDRVLSLTSIMSTTGKRTVGWQHPLLIPTLLKGTGPTRDAYIERAMASATAIGSSTYPPDPDRTRLRSETTYDRGWTASGVLRHMMAVLTQPDRTSALGQIQMPTTVIHGTADRLVHPSGGRATAEAIAHATHLEIEGMAHDLPPALWDQIIDAIVDTTARI